MKSSFRSPISFLPFLQNHSAAISTNSLIYNSSPSPSYFTTGCLPAISSSRRQAPWDSRPETLFQLNPWGNSPYLTSSLTIGWACPLWIWLAFVKCTYRTYSLLLKILPCALYTSSLSVQALQSRSCLCLTYLMLQRRLSHLNGHKLDHRHV
jgi:hypothetical protein